MIRSMTGYSRVQAMENGLSLSVVIRSINHRYLDTQVRLPSELESLEPLVRRLVKEQIARGHIEVTIALECSEASELQLDRNLLSAYVAAYRTLRIEFGSTSEPNLVDLLRVPGMVQTGSGEMPPQELRKVEQVLERTATEALESLNAMRAREGEALERDLRSRLGRLQELGEGMGRLARDVPKFYRQRLEARIRDLQMGAELDEARLAQEVAYLASRSDIAEELTRLRSHLNQAQHLLEAGAEVGKKLDFLLQELNREANTILSKTTDVPEVGLEIARQSIEMKTEIEKSREQAQNIE